MLKNIEKSDIIIVWKGAIYLNKCIYTGKETPEASFDSAEHIFPKCIGGQNCLPRGYVSDEINNIFSKYERHFAREYPTVFINRMFYPKVGRRHHKNREKVTAFKHDDKVMLGYISEAKPTCLNQISFFELSEETLENALTCKITLSPTDGGSNKERYEAFLEVLKKYNGCPSSIKSDVIPDNTILLGCKDKCWYLGISKNQNPELIKTMVFKAVQKLIANLEKFNEQYKESELTSNQVTASFEIMFNFEDVFRVYAKIAFNALASLKGQEYVLKPEFDDIRNAILEGENILSYVTIADGKNVLKEIIDKFSERVSIGDRCHSVVFCTLDNCLYGFVSLFGGDQPIAVKIGTISTNVVDMYLCDWENKKDYKLIDYVTRVCAFNHEDMIDTFDM